MHKRASGSSILPGYFLLIVPKKPTPCVIYNRSGEEIPMSKITPRQPSRNPKNPSMKFFNLQPRLMLLAQPSHIFLVKILQQDKTLLLSPAIDRRTPVSTHTNPGLPLPKRRAQCTPHCTPLERICRYWQCQNYISDYKKKLLVGTLELVHISSWSIQRWHRLLG